LWPGKRKSNNELRRQGETNIQATIAQQPGVDPATVSRDLNYLDSEWRKTQITRQLRLLDHLFNEARAAWERSKLEDVELTTETAESAPAPGATTEPAAVRIKARRKVTTLVRRNDADSARRISDPRFLAEMRGILAARREIYWAGTRPATRSRRRSSVA
jgi:hypothetical protein